MLGTANNRNMAFTHYGNGALPPASSPRGQFPGRPYRLDQLPVTGCRNNYTDLKTIRFGSNGHGSSVGRQAVTPGPASPLNGHGGYPPSPSSLEEQNALISSNGSSSLLKKTPPPPELPEKKSQVVVTALPLKPGHGGPQRQHSSISCPLCGGCRCAGCRNSRRLPERWLCHGRCLCSADSVVDTVSCLCCARASFYHCLHDSDDGANVYAEDPCSCAPEGCVKRYACLGLLSLTVPCLLCYWPGRAATCLCQACYARCRGRGCHCSDKDLIRAVETDAYFQ